MLNRHMRIDSHGSARAARYDLLRRFSELHDMHMSVLLPRPTLHRLRLDACAQCLGNWVLDA